MQKIKLSAIFSLLAITIIAAFLGPLYQSTHSATHTYQSNQSNRPNANVVDLPQPNPAQGLIADPSTNQLYIPPRHLPGRAPQTASITVNWNPSSCSADVSPWPADAQAAFAFAVDIWESVIVSTIPIEVDACWRPLGTNVLGAAGTTSIRRNFSGAPVPNTWYPVALANEATQSDLNGNEAEIIAHFSSQFTNWYFGTDGQPGPSQYDFVTVVVHEIAHGLGFAGSMSVMSGTGQYGYSGLPTAFDRFAENGGGVALVGGFPNGSGSLAAQLTGNNIYFDAPAVRDANGGTPAELHAPASWVQGTSFSHLDDSFDNSNNALMTHSISNGEAIHDPGTVTLALLSDMGWETSVFVQPVPLTPTPTPTQNPNSPTPEPSATPTVPGVDDVGEYEIYFPLVVR